MQYTYYRNSQFLNNVPIIKLNLTHSGLGKIGRFWVSYLGPWLQTLSNYLVFQSFDIQRFLRLFQTRILHNILDIYVLQSKIGIA